MWKSFLNINWTFYCFILALTLQLYNRKLISAKHFSVLHFICMSAFVSGNGGHLTCMDGCDVHLYKCKSAFLSMNACLCRLFVQMDMWAVFCTNVQVFRLFVQMCCALGFGWILKWNQLIDNLQFSYINCSNQYAMNIPNHNQIIDWFLFNIINITKLQNTAAYFTGLDILLD